MEGDRSRHESLAGSRCVVWRACGEDSWGRVMRLHLAVGIGPGLLSSPQLLTSEGLIGKAMSPGCECVTETGVEAASAGRGRAGRKAASTRWTRARHRRGHKEGGLAPPASRPLGPGNRDHFTGEKKTLGQGLHFENSGTSIDSSLEGQSDSHLHPGRPSSLSLQVYAPSHSGQAKEAASPISSQNHCAFSGLLGPFWGLCWREHFIPAMVWVTGWVGRPQAHSAGAPGLQGDSSQTSV